MAICGSRFTRQIDGYKADVGSDDSSAEEATFTALTPAFSLDPAVFVQQLQSGFSEQLIEQLTSQGFHETLDASGAFYHDTTNSPAYIRSHYKRKSLTGLNMDSGAILQSDDKKKIIATVFDGVSEFGFKAAYAAHLFADLLIHELAKTRIPIGETQGRNFERASKIFTNVAKKAKSHCKGSIEAGATAGFVYCQESPSDTTRVKAFVATLGDVAIYHIGARDKRARQINKIFRQKLPDGTTDQRDTGGYLEIGGMYGKISVAEIDIEKDDLMLLATDGLLDNLKTGQAEDILSFVINHLFFDQPFDEKRVSAPPQWEEKGTHDLPTLDELERHVSISSVTHEPLSPSRTVKRVHHYLRLVNHSGYLCDEKKYSPMGSLTEPQKKVPGKPDDIMLLCIRL